MKNLNKTISFLCISFALTLSMQASAHPGHDHKSSASAAKKSPFLKMNEPAKGAIAFFNGPKEAVGVSAKNLASIPLGAEIEGMYKRQMRARLFTIAPRGSVPPHPHNDRPGHAYILSGEITEYRNDEAAPAIRRAGDVAVEKKGVDHAWINHTDQPVLVLVVDVFNP